MSRLIIRKAAVLGAGVMGAQIAAHLANANVPVVLFDLPAKDANANELVRRAVEGLKKLTPAPALSEETLQYIDIANYDDDLSKLQECDLVIEAIAERLEWKEALYRRIAPYMAPDAVIGSNTSGLSINQLADYLPHELRARFCGIHFFNPPRYMKLVELVRSKATGEKLLDQLEAWLTTRLGKGVVRAKDTPNFIGNRVGIFSMLAVMHHCQRLGVGCDVADALTGVRIGRPRSATFRTADVVGLDTFNHVVKTMEDTLPDDPWHSYFHIPKWMEQLIQEGALGQKVGKGVYSKGGNGIQVFDTNRKAYRPAMDEIDPDVALLLSNPDHHQRLLSLRASDHPQAQLIWCSFRDVFHYCAHHLADIADSARDVDFALRWGFGWREGPFESWQAAGWNLISEAIVEDILAGKSMSGAKLPQWVFQHEGVHTPSGSFSAAENQFKSRSELPVYWRQLYPELLLGEKAHNQANVIWENEGVRLWTHPSDGGIAIVSIKSKMRALSRAVVAGLLNAVVRAEEDYDGLVIWHEAPFSVGADLKEILELSQAGKLASIDALIADFQQTSLAIKHSQVPVVAAVQGMALGGGCEFSMHASHRVLALESQIGLVEASVGLIPAGGGCKELVLQAADASKAMMEGTPIPFLRKTFQILAQGKKSKNSQEAVALGFAKVSDDIVFHPQELLYVAIRRARAMADAGYRPSQKIRMVSVAGREGIASVTSMLEDMRKSGTITEHDARVGAALASALCGGDVKAGTEVDVQWLLDVERKEFVALAGTVETQARIAHMLTKGKPLRN